ncbi:hypothetical protein ADK66_03000 [Micromonospora sp. NRRL B-16802]|uniref:hypothetical protein n=1 Tax=Micromonospora sp. NRRL B-16802 TaxID=1415541 RepID=UPI0006B05AD4|nr:hypothetical protein [Micromonospora sp. NRRL B-16802]KOX14983.1 hypothetical protein ADK66_03000 [Micromonospora sp. NRRL B-16802]
MATEAEVARLRRITDLDENDPVYTESLLGLLIDDLGIEAAASQIWKEKAAAYAGLVDTTESGSSRRLSQLYDHALKMGDQFIPPDPTPAGGSSYTVEIERV